MRSDDHPIWPALSRTSTLRKRDYLERVARGGLLGRDASRLGEPDGAAGAMTETFVLMELAGPAAHLEALDR